MSVFGPLSVLISDPENPHEIEDWCRSSTGFVGVITTDVSDVSPSADIIYSYMFDTEEAVNWFKLRWL